MSVSEAASLTDIPQHAYKEGVNMARKITISILVLALVFCIGLSLVATAGAVVIYQSSGGIAVQATPIP